MHAQACLERPYKVRSNTTCPLFGIMSGIGVWFTQGRVLCTGLHTQQGVSA